MRRFFPFVSFGILGLALAAQTPPPAAPSIKWRGSLWASGVTQNRETGDGSLVFRPLDAGQSQVTLDGLMLGADVTFGKGWSAKLTVLAGQAGKIIQTSTGDTGSVAALEAILQWSGEKDILRVGRMLTFIGMESLDNAQDVAASRGLLFSFVDPNGQVGLNWHHAFNPSWSSDAWVFNGEDRVKDNNHRKTAGLGLTYNPKGSADNYLSVHAYRGPEQDGLGTAANSVAESRLRERLCVMGQGIWGKTTLQSELAFGRERFAPGAIKGSPEQGVTAAWRGVGLILKVEVVPKFSFFARAEYLEDDKGVRLAFDPSIRSSLGLDAPLATYIGSLGAMLKAQSYCLGVEKKKGPAYARLELRQDRLNADLKDAKGKPYRDGLSATLSLGASF